MLLAETAAAERGENPQPGGAGNAFSITISPEGAVIRNAVVEGAAPERYSLAELRAALETWIAALERDPPFDRTSCRSLTAGKYPHLSIPKGYTAPKQSYKSVR